MSSIPETTHALHTTAPGQPLSLTTLAVPEPQQDSVLVKVISTALNPHDSLILNTGLLIPSFPFIPGADVAGTVVKLGPGVTKYEVGDVVFGQTNWMASDDSGPRFRDFAGLREYALVDARSSAKVSECGLGDGKDAIDAALTMPTNAVAALWGFLDDSGFGLPLSSFFGVSKEERKKDGFDASQHDLVVIGGGSQCGKLAVQVARIMGWRRIVVVVGNKNEEELKSLGAADVIDRRRSNKDIIEQIRAIVGDELRYVFNAVSHDKTVAVGVLSNSVEGHLNNITTAEVKDKDLVGEKKAGYKETLSQGLSLRNIEAASRFWEKLPGMLQTGEVKIPKWTVIEGLDADEVMKALNRYRDGKAVPEHVHIRL